MAEDATAKVAVGVAIALGVLNLAQFGWTMARTIRQRTCVAAWIDPLTGGLLPDIERDANIAMVAALAKQSELTADELARAAFLELAKTRPCVGVWAEQSVTTAVYPALIQIAQQFS
jgi:hypothetical protein